MTDSAIFLPCIKQPTTRCQEDKNEEACKVS